MAGKEENRAHAAAVLHFRSSLMFQQFSADFLNRRARHSYALLKMSATGIGRVADIAKLCFGIFDNASSYRPI